MRPDNCNWRATSFLAYKMSPKCSSSANALTLVTVPTRPSLKGGIFLWLPGGFSVQRWRQRQGRLCTFYVAGNGQLESCPLGHLSCLALWSVAGRRGATREAESGECSPFWTVRKLSYTQDPEPPPFCSQENAHCRPEQSSGRFCKGVVTSVAAFSHSFLSPSLAISCKR